MFMPGFCWNKKLGSGFLLLIVASSFFGAIGWRTQLAIVAGDSGTDDWTMFRHDLTHSGYSTSNAPDINQILWNYTTSSYVYSCPAVVKGAVYIGSADHNVYALDAAAGTFLWNYTTGERIYSSPAVVNGVVYVGSYDHNVYALNASNGAFLWSYTTGDVVLSSPAVANGAVFVGSWDDRFYCLNAATGTLISSYTTRSDVYSSPAVANGVVYVGSNDNRVYAFGALPTPTFTLTTNSTVCSVGESVRLTGTLSLPKTGKVALDWAINSSGFIYHTNETITNGMFTSNFPLGQTGTWQFRLIWPGDATSNSATSNIVTVTVTASAKPRTVGVSVGNKFRYSVTVSWSSTDPNATPPSCLVEYNNTQWLEITITAISGTNITGQTTIHFKNGTETTAGGWLDVSTGDGVNITSFIISANLTAGDSAYTSSPFNTWIMNETVPKTYLSGVRDTNHLDMLNPTGCRTNLYWDKSTGIWVESSQETTNQTGAYTTTWSQHAQIISSAVWTVPEFPAWTPALLILTVLTSATIVIARQRQPRRPFR